MSCSKLVMCTSCISNSNEHNQAKFLCVICRSNYCQECSEMHRSAAKDHRLQLLNTEKQNRNTKSEKAITCEECNKCSSDSVCISCNKTYCFVCKELHKKFNTSKQISHEHANSTKWCLTCKQYGVLSISKAFCVGCMRLFCDECYDAHMCSNATKKIGFVIQIPFCEPCNTTAIITTGTIICIDCDEFMCDTCWKKHVALKKMNSHKRKSIRVSESLMKNTILCGPCGNNQQEEKAQYKCIDCEEELLCEECADHHRTFKHTKDHRLTELTFRPKQFINQAIQTERFNLLDKETETFPTEESINCEKHRPGKPEPSYIGVDTVTLNWASAIEFSGNAYYQVSYREVVENSTWKFNTEEVRVSNLTVLQLRASTAYQFRVRVVYDVGDGPFSPISDKIFTQASLAWVYKGISEKVRDGNPSPDVYALPLEEKKYRVNTRAKAKAFEIAKSEGYNDSEERTILFVGTNGCGKSSAIDGIVNYVLGVQWDDNFRFTVENTLKNHEEWINVISLNPSNSNRFHRRLNVVCVPTFGVSTNSNRDMEIIEQVRKYLTDAAPQGLEYLDAVYFVVKSSDLALSKYQMYIFQMVLSLLGNDLEENLFLLCTFSDCKSPRVLTASNNNLPIRNCVCINNAALFEANRGHENGNMVKMFWTAGFEMYTNLFKQLNEKKTRTLKLTRDVVDKKLHAHTIYERLFKDVDDILEQVQQLHEVQKEIENVESIKTQNANYMKIEKVTEYKKVETQPGIFALNCQKCQHTCLQNIASLEETIESYSIFYKTKRCKICLSKCSSIEHIIEPSCFAPVITYVSKVDQAMKGAFENAGNALVKIEEKVKFLSDKINHLFDTSRRRKDKLDICCAEITRCSLPLKSHLSKCNEIDSNIESEKEQRQEGFKERIKQLENVRKYAELLSDMQIFERNVRSVLTVVGGARSQDADASTNFASFVKLYTELHAE